MITYLRNSPNNNFVFSSFFPSSHCIQIFSDCFTHPLKMIYLQASKDQVHDNIMQFYKTKAKKNEKFEEYEQFLDGYKDVLKLVQKLVIFIIIIILILIQFSHISCKLQPIKKHWLNFKKNYYNQSILSFWFLTLGQTPHLNKIFLKNSLHLIISLWIFPIC